MPNKSQIEAIKTWATAYGRTWKHALQIAWINGDYREFQYSDTAAYLQQIRNSFGPSWLDRFVLCVDGSWMVKCPACERV